ncbi:autotransporter assembly complex protein TamA [Thauera linaloolentis]|uniref:Surface antigen (D15) n=1 Tax=Thauera linaloolentis (strain DSM 12138 / JCM 21573 / CCUG 41526 / CIP 105981 / IAM 15112 / NBRC 102519 / 47Lol) TaxID=1123367 RepID=N6Y7T9_THAL4|nr:autotransporter assembly complex family protein [Thauera linaloolentis]ENO90331.1 surface antigen (D15) [Thauera linaloolentis 47Lol = DSM 12138]MCM8564096.1 autotransporter assembly complex protein TamA [Thauera linaloolentis]
MGVRKGFVSLLLGAALQAALPASAQQALDVALEAPDEVRPLLERHVRLLRSDELALPEAAPDRSAMVRRTRREVEQLLATEGYFSPVIGIDRSEAGRWLLKVEPGPRARVEQVSIAFEGEVALAREDGGQQEQGGAVYLDALRARWSLPAGAPFRQADWDAAKQALLDAIAARRYAAARIVASRAEVDPEAASVRLSITLDSGPAFYLGKLEVSGLQELPADLVQRYSRLKAGAPYDREELLAFQTGLQNTPHFASVIVDIDRDPALAAAVPVRVQVAEARPRYIGFGAGVSSNTGFRVEATYRDANLLRRGWELSTGLRLEQRRQSAYADVFLPPSGRHRDSFGALVDRSDLEGLRIESQAVGVARTTVRGDIETQLALRLQHERMRPDGAQASSQNTLTVNWTWIQRAVDDLLDPTHGHVLEFQLGGGAAVALADRDFVRVYGRAVRYQPVGERDVFILRGEAGVTLADSREGIPQDFLFRTGGAQSVRGYAYQSLGVSEGEATVGGRYLGTMSAEYVRWFRPQWGAAVFVDAGDAADTREDFDLHAGYGVGARWRSPAGPLAIDLAWGHEERKLRLHFGVAIAF